MAPVGVCRMCLVDDRRAHAVPTLTAGLLRAGHRRPWRSSPTPTGSRRPRTGVLGVPAGQPPARLPRVRQGRRVPAAGPDARATVRVRAASSRRSATGPSRSKWAHWFALDRERCIQCARCTRFAEEVAGDAQIDFRVPGPTSRSPRSPRVPLRLVLLRQHRADLPRRHAHGDPVPLQGAPVGPRAGRVDVLDLCGRLPVAAPSSAGQLRPLPRSRLDPSGERQLAV